MPRPSLPSGFPAGFASVGVRAVYFYHTRKWGDIVPLFCAKLLKTIKTTDGFWGEFAPFGRFGYGGAGRAPGRQPQGPARLGKKRLR